ncbi:MAG: hypothetical protein GEV08_25425, partial [Acidimicrobiia bacterium]|nr:hypothetical protein [Acidimicrobiia bacterium]
MALHLGADVARGERVAHALGGRPHAHELVVLHRHLQCAAVRAVERTGREGEPGCHRVTVGLRSCACGWFPSGRSTWTWLSACPTWPLPTRRCSPPRSASTWAARASNQAVAVARLGAQVALVGLVCDDACGDALLGGLERNGVGRAHVGRVAGPSGLALCQVADDGSSAIVVVPGANALVAVEHAERAVAALRDADVLLLQGEVPVAACRRAAELARAAGALVVVNPAPVGPGSAELVGLASLVV